MIAEFVLALFVFFVMMANLDNFFGWVILLGVLAAWMTR